MEFEKKKVSVVDSFRGFVSKVKSNPITKQNVLIAKDTSYPYQKSDDAYVLLLPLAVKEMYMYVQPYVDSRTELTEFCIKVSKITNLTLSGNAQIHVFNSSASTADDVRLNKGIRYVPFLADFFDPEKNKTLYKCIKNARMLCERKIKYDTDKAEYEDRSGYVEVQHLRVQCEGSIHNYVQMMCVKAFKGERAPANVHAFLDGEWKYVSRYLNFIVTYYKLNDIGRLGGIEKKRIETVRRDVLDVMDRIEKSKKKNDVNVTTTVAEDVVDIVEENGPSSSKKRKMPKKEKVTKTVKINPKTSVTSNIEHGSDKETESPSNASNNNNARGIEDELFKSIRAIDAPSRRENGQEENIDQENKGIDVSGDESDSLECDEDFTHSQYP